MNYLTNNEPTINFYHKEEAKRSEEVKNFQNPQKNKYFIIIINIAN